MRTLSGTIIACQLVGPPSRSRVRRARTPELSDSERIASLESDHRVSFGLDDHGRIEADLLVGRRGEMVVCEHRLECPIARLRRSARDIGGLRTHARERPPAFLSSKRSAYQS